MVCLQKKDKQLNTENCLYLDTFLIDNFISSSRRYFSILKSVILGIKFGFLCPIFQMSENLTIVITADREERASLDAAGLQSEQSSLF